jgi:serine/threonine protein kinase
MPQNRDSMVGMMIIDQYYISDTLGQGAMGRVYVAEQREMERLAAIKILRLQNSGSGATAARFRREARAISRLAHQNIVTVYNFGELADGSLFLAMEYIDGQDLGVLVKEGPLPVFRALNVVHQAAAGLDHAHGHGIIHRDLKPENIMLTKQLGRDHVKLLDFGIARLTDDSFSSNSENLVGTPAYLSPEQCRGAPANELSDQYALGLVLYEMLTGQRAIQARGILDYLHRHQYDEPTPPSALRDAPGIELLDPVVARMIAKDPATRFPDMETLQSSLEPIARQLLRSNKKGLVSGADLPAIVGPAPPAREAPAALAPPGPRPPDSLEMAAISPSRVVVLGSDVVVNEAGWESLSQHWYHHQATCFQANELSRLAKRPDLWLLGTTRAQWRGALKAWIGPQVPENRVLVCVDCGKENSECVSVVKQASHVLISPQPVEPLVLTAALRWMQGRGSGALDLMASGSAVQVLQATSLAFKQHYVAQVIDDLRESEIHRPVQRAVKELCEELLMNALVHAPVTASGWRRYADMDEARASALRHGQEAILRWAITDRFIFVSVRDRFGSLTAEEISAALSGQLQRAESHRESRGSGLGLRIICRAASHLIIFISPGKFCEILALVARDPARTPRQRSLCVLKGWDDQVQQIGEGLWMFLEALPDATRITLRGEINETADLRCVFNRADRVYLNLAAVDGINSRGINAWLMASKGRHPDLQLLMESCSPSMVSQFNMLPLMAESGAILSIFAAYYCPACQKESSELLPVEELYHPLPPPRRCKICNGELEFDEQPEEYFAFLDSLDR